jgi:hypothetical protein
MDIRNACDTSLPSRTRLLIALLLPCGLVFTPALAWPGEAQTGNYLGSLESVPVTVRTDAGERASSLALDLVLDIAPAAQGGRHAVTVHDVDLSAAGVATGAGHSGDLDGDLKASAKAPIGPNGRVALSISVMVHYPLIDRIFPPSPEPFRETFAGTLTGNLSYDPIGTAWTFDGTLHLDVQGAATGKVLALDLPLAGVPFYPDSAVAALRYPRQPAARTRMAQQSRVRLALVDRASRF